MTIRYLGFVLAAVLSFGIPQGLLAQTHADRDKFHADVAHGLLGSYEALDTISYYHARDMMPDNRDEMHEKVAHGFKHALESFGAKPEMTHRDRNKLHAHVAHALLEVHETLAIIADYHSRGSMPKERDKMHDVVAHGFKEALERFGISPDMPEHTDKHKFHGDVAHALLESYEVLSTISHYHAIGAMPEDRDEMHEKAAHGFKHAMELFGIETKM